MRKKRSISQQLSVNNRFIAAVMFFVLSLVTALPLSAREIQKMEKKMKKKNEGTYNYFADGAKFSLTDANGLTRLYLGPFTLPEKYRVRLPNFTEDLSFSNGYISEDSPTTAVQPYKLLYNGKELQLMAQTPLIDYGARQYNPITTRWNAPDPMSEKYYAYSAYAYCVGDPNNRMDIDGLWDIKVSANSDRSKQPYAILTVTDRTGRIIYRTVVKVKGSYRDRTKTNADTPTGNYKILEWRRTGNNTNYNISSYGPNDLLALDYQKGEAEGKRNGIHVHGGEKGTDKQSLKGTYGCIRISNDDIKELKELTESLEATDPKEKKGYLTVANDLDEDIDYSDREQIKNDWVRDAGFLSPITVTGNRTERKNNDDSNVNLFQKIWNSFLSILSTSR